MNPARTRGYANALDFAQCIKRLPLVTLRRQRIGQRPGAPRDGRFAQAERRQFEHFTGAAKTGRQRPPPG